MVVSLAPVFLSKIFCLESGALLDNLQDIYIYIYTINQSTTCNYFI